jgi:hypothetical protein
MKRVATLILAALPFAVHAQTAPATQEIVVEKNTTVVVKEAPKPSPVTFAPYGFILANAFFSDGPFASKVYPGQVLPCPASGTTNGCNVGGSVNMTAQQTRVGMNITFDDTAGWTMATLSGRIEADFNGGANFAGAAAVNSTVFYNALVRLRLAYMKASWGGFSILGGQDYALLAPLFATSVAWQAVPIFWQAGNPWNRSPQIKVAFDATPKDGLAFGVAVAALNPSDATVADNPTGLTTSPGAAVDFGAGNRSRMPAFEGRIYAGLRMKGVKTVELGFGGHTNTRRYISPASGKDFDVNENSLALDLEANIAFITLKAEAWMGNAIDDFYAGIVQPPVVIRTTGTGAALNISKVQSVATKGGWAQLVLSPFPFLQLTAGYGVEVANTAQMTGMAANTRYRNSQFAYGLIFPAGKYWRFSLEGDTTITNYYGGQNAKASMYALSSQLSF